MRLIHQPSKHGSGHRPFSVFTSPMLLVLFTLIIPLPTRVSAATASTNLRSRNGRVLQDKRDVFVATCVETLGSNAEDGLLSQVDFMDFLRSVCERDDCPTEFHNLNIMLQLTFTHFICNPESEVDRGACAVEMLRVAEDEFGQVVTAQTQLAISESIADLCEDAFLYVGNLFADTDSPVVTEPPVTAPVTAPVVPEPPVAAPVVAPVTGAVEAPVVAPVAAPVAAPVTGAVEAPVVAPVAAPAAAPVTGAVEAPVVAPVAAPGNAPTAAPVVVGALETTAPTTGTIEATNPPTTTASPTLVTPPPTANGAVVGGGPPTSAPSVGDGGDESTISPTSPTMSPRPSPMPTLNPTVTAPPAVPSTDVPSMATTTSPDSHVPTVPSQVPLETAAPTEYDAAIPNPIVLGGDGNGTGGDTLNPGAVAGISVAAALFVIVMIAFARAYRNQRNEAASSPKSADRGVPMILGDESIASEDSQGLPFFKSGSYTSSSNYNQYSSGGGGAVGILGAAKAIGSDVWSMSDNEDHLVDTGARGFLQFDAAAASAIALFRRDPDKRQQRRRRSRRRRRRPSMSSQGSSVNQNRGELVLAMPAPDDDLSASSRQKKQDNLDVAIEKGDWAAVAKIAASIAGSEDLSSISPNSIGRSTGSPESQGAGEDTVETGSRATSQRTSDDERTAQLDTLIERGDWNALAAAAKTYAYEDSSASSAAGSPSGTSSGGESGSSGAARSFIDFVTGRRTSAAAAAAMAPTSVSAAGNNNNNGAAGVVSDSASSARQSSSSGIQATATVDVGASPVYLLGRVDTEEETVSKSGSSRQSFPSDEQEPEAGLLSADDLAVTVAESEREEGTSSSTPYTAGWLRRLGGFLPRGQQKAADEAKKPPPMPLAAVTTTSSESAMPTTTEAQPPPPPPSTPPASLAGQAIASDESDPSQSQRLRRQLVEAMKRCDWAQVESLSSQIEAITAAKKQSPEEKILSARTRAAIAMSRSSDSTDDSVVLLRFQLEEAIERSDWESAEHLSNQIISIVPSPRRPKYKKQRSTMVLHEDEKMELMYPITSLTSSPRSPQSSIESTPDDEKIQTIERMIEANNWRGVTALAGVFDLESSGTPPLASVEGTPSEDSPDRASGQSIHSGRWPGVTEAGSASIRRNLFSTATPTGDGGSPASPAIPEEDHSVSSSSTAQVTTLREFERLVRNRDWQGLADFAARDESTLVDIDQSQLLQTMPAESTAPTVVTPQARGGRQRRRAPQPSDSDDSV